MMSYSSSMRSDFLNKECDLEPIDAMMNPHPCAGRKSVRFVCVGYQLHLVAHFE